jgi:hypothetical protein
MLKLNKRGYSLVEITVAAVVISLSVFAVIAMVRKGQEHIGLDRHRREARGIVERTFESQQFAPEAYNRLNTDTTSAPLNVLIDSAANLNGKFQIKIRKEVTTPGTAPVAAVPYRCITVNVWWQEKGAGNKTYYDTVSVDKWLANVQRQ